MLRPRVRFGKSENALRCIVSENEPPLTFIASEAK
jgi:hypothetical protein